MLTHSKFYFTIMPQDVKLKPMMQNFKQFNDPQCKTLGSSKLIAKGILSFITAQLLPKPVTSLEVSSGQYQLVNITPS